MIEQPSVRVRAAFERALDAIRARVGAGPFQDHSSRPVMAIAYSGGLDSSALLHLAHDYARVRDLTLFAFHIHHGISPHADQWLAHCDARCAQLGIAFDARRIALPHPEKQGVEQAARSARYAALGALCRTHRVSLLLTAHHQDDQAETVLLQCLRGAGVAGLSGMDRVNVAPALLGDATLFMGRPLLDVTRAALADWVAEKEIAHIDDESNHDVRYARNALRHQVMPVLAQFFPGCCARLTRSAQHAQSAQRLLTVLASQDLAACRILPHAPLGREYLDLSALSQFDTDRIDNMLRYWLHLHAVRMPSTARLAEMRTQLLVAKADAQLCITHADYQIRRHRNRVFLVPCPHPISSADAPIPPLTFQWQHETHLDFPRFGGTLHFEAGQPGIAAAWLQAQTLTLRLRQGSERLKLVPNRPSKDLKHHYQAHDIPAWERPRLPLVTAQEQLLFAAGIGMDCRFACEETGIRLRWQVQI